ncbi:MAG: hypothetical protein Q9202_003985 [Teloschistes flavicans]
MLMNHSSDRARSNLTNANRSMASHATMTGAAKGDEADAPPSPIPLLGEAFSDSKARSTPEAADGVPEFWGSSEKKDDGKAKGKREAAVTNQPAPGNPVNITAELAREKYHHGFAAHTYLAPVRHARFTWAEHV